MAFFTLRKEFKEWPWNKHHVGLRNLLGIHLQCIRVTSHNDLLNALGAMGGGPWNELPDLLS